MSEKSPKPELSIKQTDVFEPSELEEPIYKWWEESGFFRGEVDPQREPFTIVIPPPNVTGALHLGHALNNTLQDILIRKARMEGYSTLWLPGTDHAGIATQAVVEKRLWEEEKKTRYDLGREAMIQRIWQWKEEYEARILGQLRKLAASADWSRTQFTMSPQLSRAVRYVFIALFKEGLIYRGKRLINWSVGIQTALSNDELVYKTVEGNFWYINYPIKELPGQYIQVATTRPETMLGDTAVAVHPNPREELYKRLKEAEKKGDSDRIEALKERIERDLPRLEKYAQLIGKTAVLPLLNREIPIIGDPELADPEKGTGAVKVTPAHDPNDYACGLRNNLPMINILNPDGTLNENAGPYAGLFGQTEGRKKVVEDLQKLGLIEKIEPIQHEVAHCYRSNIPVEPYLSNQWFVKMEPLVQLAKQCYLDGQLQFFPKHRGKDYMRWLDSTPDWCISRQLWWGHRIPIWYCLDCNPQIQLDDSGEPIGYTIPENAEPIVPDLEDPYTDPARCPTCGSHKIVQDPDVLDTWFSSQLWPLSTLGWPEETEDLNYFYPTDVLVTGRDIIALWVARMVMMGMKFRSQTPFKYVLIHGTVQDERGDIMSKSRGNGFDPVRVIEGGSDTIKGREPLGEIPAHRVEHYPLYGSDALRYGLISLTLGNPQDLRLQIVRTPRKSKGELPEYDVSIPKFEEGRRFGNKIWQASWGVIFRQCQGYTPDTTVETLEDRWLYHKLKVGLQKVEEAFRQFDLGAAVDHLYTLFWDDFCSWYLEVVKPRLWGKFGEKSKAQAQTHLVNGLDILLRLLHPFMPTITEALWQKLQEIKAESGQRDEAPALIVAKWPNLDEFQLDPEAERATQLLQKITAAVNQMRAQQPSITQKTQLPLLLVKGENAEELELAKKFLPPLLPFLRIDRVEVGSEIEVPTLAATGMAQTLQLFLPLEGLIDVEAEIKRLSKQLQSSEKNIQRLEKQLQNKNFLERAPKEIIQQTKERLELEKTTAQKLKEQLQQLEKIK